MWVYLRVDEWWKPWVNTVAYYKFDWNLNDSSWNSHNMSIYSWTLTYGTESWWWKYAYFDGVWTNYWERSFDYSWDNTISFWVNYTTNAWFWIEMWKSWTAFARISSNGIFQFISPNSISADLAAWNWNLLTQTRSWTTVKCYVNWVYIWWWTNSVTGTNNTRFKLNNPWDVNSSNYAWSFKMSELLWESKEWTAQEIADYYNQTKANYWL